MKTIDHATDPDAEAIIESIVSRKPLPDAIRRRIREEGRKLTEEIRETHGEKDIAVTLIRETRDE